MPIRILLISGSTRRGSTNTAALRTMCADAGDGVVATLHEDLADLPAFNPDVDGARTPPAVADLRRRLTSADAVVFCTPEYAGTLPGSLKNLLDWTVGSGELNRKPVAWVNVAGAGRGGGATSTLALVLRYVDAIFMESACAHIPVLRDMVGADGLVVDGATRARLAAVLQVVAQALDKARPGPRS